MKYDKACLNCGSQSLFLEDDEHYLDHESEQDYEDESYYDEAEVPGGA